MENSVLQAALEYYARGWSLIPLRMDEGKKPAVMWGHFQTHRADVSQLNTWFGNGSNYGLAVIFGAVSDGLGARDFDKMEAYVDWAAENPELACTLPTVATRRGRHVYFRMSREQEAAIRQSLGKANGKGAITFEDGELRIGVGSYVAIPPSRHPKGGQYEWLIPPNGEIPIVDVLKAGLVDSGSCNREDTGGQREQMTLGGGGGETEGQSTECPQVSQFSMVSPSSAHSLLQSVNEATERTRPTGPGQRHRLLFEFARELKSIPGLADAEVADLKPHVRRWHARAVAHIRTKPFEETWFDFAEGWRRVKSPKGEGPIDMAFAKALQADVPELATEYEQAELRLLVLLCRELQRACGEEPFFLATRTAGRLLDVHHATVSRWLRGLQTDRILKLESLGSIDRRKASRFRYIAGDL